MSDGLLEAMLRTTPQGLNMTKQTGAVLDIDHLNAVVDVRSHAQTIRSRGTDFEDATRAFLGNRPPRRYKPKSGT